MVKRTYRKTTSPFHEKNLVQMWMDNTEPDEERQSLLPQQIHTVIHQGRHRLLHTICLYTTKNIIGNHKKQTLMQAIFSEGSAIPHLNCFTSFNFSLQQPLNALCSCIMRGQISYKYLKNEQYRTVLHILTQLSYFLWGHQTLDRPVW